MKLRKIEPLKPKQKKLRVCAYARVSTDCLKQGESFENQVSTYERVIKSNPEYEFVSVYADQGMTGRSENRPEFQRMIVDCKAGKIDLIITKSISRFAEPAEKVYTELSKIYNCEYDDRGNIGKRYRRQDEIGTPFCITYDFESENDGAVTVRDRDTMQQERVKIEELKTYFENKFKF